MSFRIEKTDTGITISDAVSNISVPKADIAALISQLDDSRAITVSQFENNSFWDIAPDWAQYFAIDDDNQLIGWFFEEEPTLEFDVSWINDDTRQKTYRITHELRDRIYDKRVDFKTLRVRPEQ